MTDFLQGFKWKPTIKLAPDCLVWVQQSDKIPACPVCGGKKSFQSDITNVSVSLSTGSAPGSASFTIEVPRHGMTKYDIGGELVFKEMMEVEIWMKGRFLVNGDPRYYPVFWGLITAINVSTGPEMWSIDIQCEDILVWWRYTTLTISAAVLEAQAANTKSLVVKHIFANFNPYEIIMALTLLGFGDILAIKDLGLGDTPFLDLINKDVVDRRDEVIKYWQRRFQQVTRRLKIFGMNGFRLNRDVSDIDIKKFAEQFQDQARVGAGGRTSKMVLPGLRYDRDQFSRFRFDEFIGSNDSLTESEQQTKLDLAMNAAGTIGFEFFMDTNGDIVFKPPFYNMDVRDAGPVYAIEEEDIVSLSFSKDSNQIYTRCDVTGRWSTIHEEGPIHVFGYFVDYNLARHYGMRNLELHAPFLRTARGCYMYAVAKIAEQNAMASTATLTIMGRSELRLGRPVYIRSHDVFGYVSGITHSFSFGGTFQTTLSLTAIRTKYHPTDPKTQLDGEQPGGRQSFNVLGTGKVEGAPSRVMTFWSDEFVVELASPGEDAVSGYPKSVPGRTQAGFNADQNARFSPQEEQALAEDKNLLKAYGQAQGFWVEGEIPKVFMATERFIPISDESGYRHIGGFPYGRGMTIGSLDSIKPVSPEDEKDRGEAATGFDRRPPTVIEQYGLSAGQSFDKPPLPPSVRVAAENETHDDADATTEDNLKSLKDTVIDFREVVDEQARKNPSSSCSCTGTTYAENLIEKIIAENRGKPSAKRAARERQNTQSTRQRRPSRLSRSDFGGAGARLLDSGEVK